MEMEAAEGRMSWKALFQRRVLMAGAHCGTAHGLLRGLVVAFGEQEARDMVAGGAEDSRSALESAATELGLAYADMGAARHLALRCCGPEDDELADPEARRALGHLREATELVCNVHDLVEGARGHLSAAEVLLLVLGENDGPDAAAPWVHAPCVDEQLDGVMDLVQAVSEATELVELTAAALEAAFGVGDD